MHIGNPLYCVFPTGTKYKTLNSEMGKSDFEDGINFINEHYQIGFKTLVFEPVLVVAFISCKHSIDLEESIEVVK